MEENPNIFLRVAAGIFLTIMLISLVVWLTFGGQEAAKKGEEKLHSINTMLSETEFNTFNNTTVTGSQVLNTIRQYMNQEQFGIQVTTGKGASNFYGNTFGVDGNITETDNKKNLDFSPAEDQSSNSYVNPNGKFKSKVVKDKNNAIRGIVFVQQ
ncbi:ABC transporter permease [Bacillus cereus]|nr:ABC transporter permease [Bacillus cereus]